MCCSFLLRPTFVLFCLFPHPTLACIMAADRKLEDVKFASVVVIGSVENYQVILDPEARSQRKTMLENLPADASPEYREMLESQEVFLSDYARFDILVDEVLVGTASDKISVVWDNSTFGEPDAMASGPYLFALIVPGSPRPPLRGPSATILPHPDAVSLSVLQAPCAGPFIFPADSSQVSDIRATLSRE
jgi:hypothetical protein